MMFNSESRIALNLKLFAVIIPTIMFIETAAQQRLSDNTLTIAENQKPGKAGIKDFEGMIGYWKGEGLGGLSEEIWMPAVGGVMHGSFRLTIDGKLIFTEFMTLAIDSTDVPVLKVKHFNPDFTGWEDKDKAVNFPFIKKQGDTIYFNTLTYALEGRDKLVIYIVLSQPNGKHQEEKFVLDRYRF